MSFDSFWYVLVGFRIQRLVKVQAIDPRSDFMGRLNESLRRSVAVL